MFFNLIGSTFGDYKVVSVAGKDKSRHTIYDCKCVMCGHHINATRYELTKGKKNLKCSCDFADSVNSDTFVGGGVDTTTDNTSGYIAPTDDAPAPSIDDVRTSVGFSDGSDDAPNYITIKDEDWDIFDVPFFYDVACCCATHASPIGLSEDIIYCKGIENDIENYQISADVGDVACYKNVFVMFPTSKKHEKTTLDNLKICLENLADFCAHTHTKYLAMPYVGCGRGGLNKSDVFHLIRDCFNRIYEDAATNPAGFFFDKDEKIDNILIKICNPKNID